MTGELPTDPQELSNIIEKIMRTSAAKDADTEATPSRTDTTTASDPQHQRHDDIIADLVQRRQDTPTTDTIARRAISKKIQQNIRRQKRANRRDRIKHILEQYTGLKHISAVKTRRKKTLFPDMMGGRRCQADNKTRDRGHIGRLLRRVVHLFHRGGSTSRRNIYIATDPTLH